MSAQAMQALLGQLNALPGVVGSMLCDDRGQVLADLFRTQIDRTASQRAAEILADNASGLATVGGPVTMLSMRFADGRMLIRRLAGGHLLLLCSPSVNPQPVTLLAAATAPKLERLVAEREPPARPAAPPAAAPPPSLPVARISAPAAAPGLLYQAVQRIEAAIVRKRLDAVRTRGAIALQAGFSLRCIDAETPDDPQMLAQLEAAAAAVLGEKP